MEKLKLFKVTYTREVEDVNAESAVEKVVYELENKIIDKDALGSFAFTHQHRIKKQ